MGASQRGSGNFERGGRPYLTSMDPLASLLLLFPDLIHRFLVVPYLTHTVFLGDFDFPCPNLLLRYKWDPKYLKCNFLPWQQRPTEHLNLSVDVVVRAAFPVLYLMTCWLWNTLRLISPPQPGTVPALWHHFLMVPASCCTHGLPTGRQPLVRLYPHICSRL